MQPLCGIAAFAFLGIVQSHGAAAPSASCARPSEKPFPRHCGHTLHLPPQHAQGQGGRCLPPFLCMFFAMAAR
ncbi:hypothetical protein D3C72_1753510 [compost metagenome]